MARPDKVTAVAEIAEKFRGASASVVTEYRGLTMAQLTTLRRSLGDGTTYRVAKNTLVQRAAEDAGVEGLEQMLVGPTAIAFITGEPVDAAKAMRDFAKTNHGPGDQGRLHGRSRADRHRGQPARRPGVARGPAGQAGRRDEGQPEQGRRPVRRAGVAGRPPRAGAGRQAGRGGGRRDAPAAAAADTAEATEARGRRRPRVRLRPPPSHPEKGTATMAKLSTDELLDAFKDLTLIELSEFVKKFEETFDVTAAAPVAVAPPPRPPVAPPPPPRRRRTSSTSSSRPRARRRSRSSRSSASSSPAWASRRPRTSSSRPRSRSSRASPRTPPRPPRRSSRTPAPRSAWPDPPASTQREAAPLRCRPASVGPFGALSGRAARAAGTCP